MCVLTFRFVSVLILMIFAFQTHLYLSNESKVLAWLLDQFKQNLCEKICIDELGSVFGLLESVAYDDVPASAAYYSSVLRIVKTYARDWYVFIL